ncbi:unnamed protein product, partial [Vitis vinifera]
MINPKKLIKMARKWQKIAAMKRKRISLPRTDEDSMISPKNLIRIARKWQKVAALGRKRILLQRFNRGQEQHQTQPLLQGPSLSMQQMSM